MENSASIPQIIADVDHLLDEPSSSTGTGDDDPGEAAAGGSTGDEPRLVDADRVPRAGDHDGWTVAELPDKLVNELGQTLTGAEPGSDRPVIDVPKKSSTAPRTTLIQNKRKSIQILRYLTLEDLLISSLRFYSEGIQLM